MKGRKARRNTLAGEIRKAGSTEEAIEIASYGRVRTEIELNVDHYLKCSRDLKAILANVQLDDGKSVIHKEELKHAMRYRKC
jgi:hypothetical protein